MITLKKELKLLKITNSDYIIKFYGSFETKNEFILLQEYLKDGDLFHDLKKYKYFTEKEAAICIFHILKGLEYLQTKKLIHRDLKLKNILCKEVKPNC